MEQSIPTYKSTVNYVPKISMKEFNDQKTHYTKDAVGKLMRSSEY